MSTKNSLKLKETTAESTVRDAEVYRFVMAIVAAEAKDYKCGDGGGRRKIQQKCGGVDAGKVITVVIEVVAALQGTQY